MEVVREHVVGPSVLDGDGNRPEIVRRERHANRDLLGLVAGAAGRADVDVHRVASGAGGIDGDARQPWQLSPMERRMLCPDYPPPLIGLDEGRARALAAFEDARARAAR